MDHRAVMFFLNLLIEELEAWPGSEPPAYGIAFRILHHRGDDWDLRNVILAWFNAQVAMRARNHKLKQLSKQDLLLLCKQLERERRVMLTEEYNLKRYNTNASTEADT